MLTEFTEDSTGDSSNNSSSGNPEGFEYGNGNGEVPPGLNRREKADKPENPNKPEKPENPGTEDSSDKKANKAQQGTHIYFPPFCERHQCVMKPVVLLSRFYSYFLLI